MLSRDFRCLSAFHLLKAFAFCPVSQDTQTGQRSDLTPPYYEAEYLGALAGVGVGLLPLLC